MDQRFQYILDNYDNMLIREDSTFQFHCNQCGKCCINREDILLNPKDLYNISKELGLTPQETANRYCETYIGDYSRIPVMRLKPRGSIKRCPLLKDRKCSVHRAKPVVCAMFPLGRAIRMDQNDCKRANEIQFILNPIECGDKSETHTVREWLESFGIPLQDTFFLSWQKAIMKVREIVCTMEPIYSEQAMNIVWSVVYATLYMRYDMTQDFDRQFQNNVDSLLQVLEDLPFEKGVEQDE